jgi:hypothetical protein
MKPLILGIAGLTTLTVLLPASISPRTFFTTAQTPPPETAPDQTERFKIRLTLSNATDLKVREGGQSMIGTGFCLKRAIRNICKIAPLILIGLDLDYITQK